MKPGSPSFSKLPTQHQLILPLMDVLAENGDRPMKAADAITAVADKIGISEDLRNASVSYRGSHGLRETRLFDRQLRWTRQNGILAGLIRSAGRGLWALADPGHKTLAMAQPGTVCCVIQTDLGAVLWAEAADAMGYIENGTVSLVFSSPPYPLIRNREYATEAWSTDRYLETLLNHIARTKSLLSPDGNLVLNLADTYQSGLPTLNTYQEQLVCAMDRAGWHLCGKDIWVNPAKPKTTPWVTKNRTRMAQGFETFYWWSPTPHPKASNTRILQPYSEKMLRTIDAGGELRNDSKHASRMSSPGLRYRNNNQGSIPHNVLIRGHEGSGSKYVTQCRARGIPFHPARMPLEMAERWVKFTTEAGDLVFDPFAGSLTTAAACSKHDRRFICSEKVLQYIQGGGFRLQEYGGIKNHIPEPVVSPRLDCA